MTFKFLPVIFFCCLAFTYTLAKNADEVPESPDASDHEHGENCGHPLDKIKDGLVKIKNKISQTVTNAKNAVVEKYKNIKASIDKRKNDTVITTESYGRRNEPAVPRDPLPPIFVPPQVPQIPSDGSQSDRPLQLIPNGQQETGFSTGILPNLEPETNQGAFGPETSSSVVGSVSANEAAVNQDPSLMNLPQDPDSENPPIDMRIGATAGKIQGDRN